MNADELAELFAKDRQWLAPQPGMSPWEVGCSRLSEQIDKWLSEYSKLLCTTEIVEGSVGYASYVKRLWKCWSYHWSKSVEASPESTVDGFALAEQLRSGKASEKGRRLGGNPLKDVVLAEAVEKRDSIALLHLELEYKHLAVGYARKMDFRVADDPEGWWYELLNELVGYDRPTAKLTKYTGRCALKPWLVTVARNFARRHSTADMGLRDAARYEADLPEATAPERATEDSLRFFAKLLEDTLSRLSPHDRLFLSLRCAEGLGSGEVAKILGMHPGNVSRREKTALDRLQQLIEQQAAKSGQKRLLDETRELLSVSTKDYAHVLIETLQRTSDSATNAGTPPERPSTALLSGGEVVGKERRDAPAAGDRLDACQTSGVSRDSVKVSESAAPAGKRPPYLDENVQFTAFQPATIPAERWCELPVSAHLEKPRPDAPAHAPTPLDEARRIALQMLERPTTTTRESTQDSLHAIPQGGEVTFVLEMRDGVKCCPERQTFSWLQDQHTVLFQLRAPKALEGRWARGRVSAYLGIVLLADITLKIQVTGQDISPASHDDLQPVSARPYRKIFPSYSHRDREIVEQFAGYAKALGDDYLLDCACLRSGERWNARILELIDEADVFQLFWSTHSMHSKYVRQEWEYALERHDPEENFVRPIYWEDPRPEELPNLPPPMLDAIHFQHIGARMSTSLDNGSHREGAGNSEAELSTDGSTSLDNGSHREGAGNSEAELSTDGRTSLDNGSRREGAGHRGATAGTARTTIDDNPEHRDEVRAAADAFFAESPGETAPKGPHFDDDEELFTRWAMGTVSHEEHQAILDHLAVCRYCRKATAAMIDAGVLELPDRQQALGGILGDVMLRDRDMAYDRVGRPWYVFPLFFAATVLGLVIIWLIAWTLL